MTDRHHKNRQVKPDAYDHISLWQLLPCGNGSALRKLKFIANSILNGQAHKDTNKPLSLLISGSTGKRTHACSFLRALGVDFIIHSPASILHNPVDFIEFFYGAVPDNGYILSNINSLTAGNAKKLYQILTQGHYTYMDSGGRKHWAPVISPLICTTNKIVLPDTILNSFEHIVELGEYTPQQKELIALQRLKYANIEIENENVLKTLTLFSPSELNDMIKLLNLSIIVMMAEGRDILTSEDIRKGKEFW